MDTAEVVRFTEAMLVSSSVPETEPEWDAETVFADDARCYVTVEGIHQAFVSQQAANEGHDPLLDDGTWWLPDGPTNRWAALDQALNTYSSAADSVEWVLALPADTRINVLYLSGLIGLTARVRVNDVIEGPVFDQTVTLTSCEGILDGYTYAFNPIVRLTELLLMDLPRGAGSTLTVTVENTGSTARVGNISAGFLEHMGGTQWGANISNRDYSVEEENEFGEELTVERGFRKLASMTVIVENRAMPQVIAKLNGMRARQHLYVGDDRYAPLVILGRYEEYALEMSLPPDHSVLSIRLKSLVQA